MKGFWNIINNKLLKTFTYCGFQSVSDTWF